jgi:hypothetical protein
MLSADSFCLIMADRLAGRLSLEGWRPVTPEKSGREGRCIFKK